MSISNAARKQSMIQLADELMVAPYELAQEELSAELRQACPSLELPFTESTPAGSAAATMMNMWCYTRATSYLTPLFPEVHQVSLADMCNTLRHLGLA